MKNTNIPKDIREKIDHWTKKNNDFIDSLNDLNKYEIEILLKEGYPHILDGLLSEEEHNIVGTQEFENLCDKFDDDMVSTFNSFYEKPNNEEILEILADFFIYQKSDLALDFRKKYFTYIKNNDIALVRAKSLFEENNDFIEEKNNWLKGVLYNDSNEIFDGFYGLYLKQPINEDELFSSLNALRGAVLSEVKYYNLDSWVKHYKNFFPKFAELKLSRLNGSNGDFIADVVFDLIKYPIEQYEKEKNINLVKPILDFLIEDYSLISGISKLNYLMVYLYYEKYKEKTFAIEKHSEDKKSTIPIKSYRKLFIQHSLDSVSLKLDNYIDKSIKDNNPIETLDFFKAIDLPKEKYQVLDSYVSLALKLPNNIDILNKKTQKI
jgi:hypothetical protein